MLLNEAILPTQSYYKKKCIAEIYTILKKASKEKNNDIDLLFRCLYALDYYSSNSQRLTILGNGNNNMRLIEWLIDALNLDAVALTQHAPFLVTKFKHEIIDFYNNVHL